MCQAIDIRVFLVRHYDIEKDPPLLLTSTSPVVSVYRYNRKVRDYPPLNVSQAPSQDCGQTNVSPRVRDGY